MIDGLVVVDKAPGWTSHDVVARCRGIFSQRKVGHSGTLDPDASGILLVGLGRVTRLLRFLTALPKTYTAQLVLGTATSTLDSSGAVVGEWDMSGVDIDTVRRAAHGLTGEIRQVPPMVSAVSVGGRRLHELARAGVEVERQARTVTVHRFGVRGTDDPLVFDMEVECSSGTYVRSLAADVGAALGGGAHVRSLRRTSIGSFTEAEARPLEALSPEAVIAPVDALRDYPAVPVDPDTATAVGHGRRVPGLPDGTVRLVGPGGSLIAVYTGGRPEVVLAPV